MIVRILVSDKKKINPQICWGRGSGSPDPPSQTVTVNIPFQDYSHWATMIHKTNCSQTQDLHYNTVAVVIHFQLGA